MMSMDFVVASKQHHVFSRDIIKPSSPTPSHLKRYNLSYVDQTLFRNYIPIVFFFPSDDGRDSSPEKIGEESRQLKHSLSKTLTQYYPFAGRLSDGAYVDCNDQGIEFEEARIECELSDILKRYEDDAADLESVFPRGSVWATFGNDSSLMIVRLNYFSCGGIAIAVCLSHRIADGCTFANFMNYWAAVTCESGEQILPHFISSISSNDNNDFLALQQFQLPEKKRVRRTRRFVFKNTKIEQLKARVATSDGQTPTRFEFLAALLYKCAMAADKSKSGSFKPSAMVHPVNMRPKMVPQLPTTSVGNFLLQLQVKTTTEKESSLNTLIDQIKKEKLRVEGMQISDGKELLSAMLGAVDNINNRTYVCGTMCNFGLYKVNFGRGKPVQVALGDSAYENCYHFMDTPNGDGIEALVCLEEQETIDFYLDEELEALY